VPTTYHLDVPNRLVCSRAWGVFTEEELAAHSRHLGANPRFEPGFRQLIDFLDVTEFRVTARGISEVARINPFGKGARRAALVKGSLGFGLARMYEQFRRDSSDDYRVFRDRAAALAWLDLPPDWAPPPPAPDDPVFTSSKP